MSGWQQQGKKRENYVCGWTPTRGQTNRLTYFFSPFNVCGRHDRIIFCMYLRKRARPYLRRRTVRLQSRQEVPAVIDCTSHRPEKGEMQSREEKISKAAEREKKKCFWKIATFFFLSVLFCGVHTCAGKTDKMGLNSHLSVGWSRRCSAGTGGMHSARAQHLLPLAPPVPLMLNNNSDKLFWPRGDLTKDAWLFIWSWKKIERTLRRRCRMNVLMWISSVCLPLAGRF